MDFDQDKVDDVVMGLLTLTMYEDHGVMRAWKGQAWEVMDRLHERGWIQDPKGKAKSVVLTPEGVARARELFDKHFGSQAN